MKKVKAVLSLILAVLLCVSVFGCSNPSDSGDGVSSPPSGAETSGTTSPDGSGGPGAPSDSGKRLRVAYLAFVMSISWNVQMVDAFNALADEYNIEFFFADGGASFETQLNQVDQYIAMGVDAIVIMPGDSSGVGEVYAERCAEAGILLLGNTVPLFNEDRTLAAPSNWLDGNELGYNMATWFVENHSHFGFDISNMSSVGYLYIHDTTVATMPPRVNGSMGVMREAFPELQDDHIFSADVSVDRNVSIMECSYNLVAATLTANPRIEKWIIFGFLDDYGTGACRAIEDLGFVDNAFLISAGGENAIPEWDAGLTRPWYAANLITGMDCALQQVEAIDRILRQGVAPEDVHPNKGPGERFGLASYSGQMIDYETYRSVIG